MEILGKLFGTPARVKIMRLFLLNQETPFDSDDIVERSRVTRSAFRKEINTLSSIGFVKKKRFVKEEVRANGKVVKKKKDGWLFDATFPFVEPLKSLLVDPEFMVKDDLITRLKRAGKVKLLIVSGIFLQESDSRVDLLIVGENIRRPKMEDIIRKVEAEIGKELSYAIFDTQEFLYRLNMYDKLIRDVLDFPHERLVEAKEFSTYLFTKKA